MFSQLAAPMAILCLLLMVPGYLFLRLFRLPRTWSISTAPIISIGLIGVVGEIYRPLGVPAVPVTVIAPLVALPVVTHLLIAWMGSRGNKASEKSLFAAQVDDTLLPDIPWWLPLLFVALGLMVSNNVFISELDSANAFLQQYDVTHHVNIIQAFHDAQTISSIGVSPYLAPNDAAIMPYGFAATYPSGWYAICALLMHATGISTPAAINASMAVITGVVLPLASLSWATLIFEGFGASILATSLTCVAFATFPWSMLIFGPLYPNLAGFAALPATSALFMLPIRMFMQAGAKERQKVPLRRIALYAIPFVTASAGQALLHPNTLFAIFLMLAPYCAWCVYDHNVTNRGKGVLQSIVFAAVFIIACAAVWTTCFFSPAFDPIVGEYWPGFAYSWQEVINIVTQTYVLGFFNEIAAQVVLGALAIIGWVRCAYERRLRWLAVSYVIVCFVNYAGACISNVLLKQFITGFWYTDSMRLAAMACLLAALLAAHGLAWVYENACLLMRRYNDGIGRNTHPLVIAGVIGLVFFVQNYMPGFNWPGAHKVLSTAEFNEKKLDGREYDTLTVKTTFGDFRQVLRDAYHHNNPIDAQEREFLSEVASIVPNDALIINNPMDGSFLAYGSMGLRVYYREFGYAGSSTEVPQSVIIRTRLRDIATDDEVRNTVNELGAKYVIVLSENASALSFINLRGDFGHSGYAGISEITPDTPGFTVLLANGACTLYKID